MTLIFFFFFFFKKKKKASDTPDTRLTPTPTVSSLVSHVLSALGFESDGNQWPRRARAAPDWVGDAGVGSAAKSDAFLLVTIPATTPAAALQNRRTSVRASRRRR